MAVPKRFGVLRLVGTLLKVIAWIILALSVVFAIVVGIADPNMVGGSALGGLLPANMAVLASGGIVAGIIGLIIGLIYFLLLYATGESVHLQVALEENTRLTAALLLRMHQESQVEAEADYVGDFGREPFEG
ncbi:MAG: hypothetical protein R2911_12360 [Caldilineaceae bacterium]